jgi:hypothetical protein
MEIVVKKFAPMPFLTGYPNSLQSIPDFSLAKHRK